MDEPPVDIVEMLRSGGLPGDDRRHVHNALIDSMIEGWVLRKPKRMHARVIRSPGTSNHSRGVNRYRRA
jgi:hypothetical protein